MDTKADPKRETVIWTDEALDRLMRAIARYRSVGGVSARPRFQGTSGEAWGGGKNH